MTETMSAAEWGFIGRDRARETMQRILRAAQARQIDDVQLGQLAQLKPRYIKSLRVEDKVPNMAAMLCIASSLGKWAVNEVLALIRYTSSPLEEEDRLSPMAIVAGCLGPMATIADAALDNRFDHTEEDSCRIAADMIIATVLPISSAGAR